MAGDSLNISYDEVRQLADRIAKKNIDLNDKLCSIQKQMQNLNDAWDSKGASSIKASFEKQKVKMEGYYKVVESYSMFLNEVVRRYSDLDDTLSTHANDFE